MYLSICISLAKISRYIVNSKCFLHGIRFFIRRSLHVFEIMFSLNYFPFISKIVGTPICIYLHMLYEILMNLKLYILHIDLIEIKLYISTFIIYLLYNSMGKYPNTDT